MPAQALQEVLALLVVRDSLGAHNGHISADGHHYIRMVDICACRVYCPECDHLLRHMSKQSHTVPLVPIQNLQPSVTVLVPLHYRLQRIPSIYTSYCTWGAQQACLHH